MRPVHRRARCGAKWPRAVLHDVVRTTHLECGRRWCAGRHRSELHRSHIRSTETRLRNVPLWEIFACQMSQANDRFKPTTVSLRGCRPGRHEASGMRRAVSQLGAAAPAVALAPHTRVASVRDSISCVCARISHHACVCAHEPCPCVVRGARWIARWTCVCARPMHVRAGSPHPCPAPCVWCRARELNTTTPAVSLSSAPSCTAVCVSDCNVNAC